MSSMMTYKEDQPGVRRGLGLGVVILIHGLLIWALASGLGTKVVEMVKAPLEVAVLKDEPEKPDDTPPPPPPPPKFIEPQAFVPKPEIVINTPAPPPPAAITAVQTEKKPEPTETIPFSPPSADPGHANSHPAYPPAARRGGQEGRVVLLLQISETGDVVDGSVAETSGYPLLDNAALKHALGRWHFKPAMRGGKPVAISMRFAIVFRLTDG